MAKAPSARPPSTPRPPRPPRPSSAPRPPRIPLTLDLSPSKTLAAPPWLAERAASIGIEFDKDDVEKLGLYLGCLFYGNEQLNLTAVTDVEKAWDRHILDSLTLLATLADLPKGSKVIDIGSGGGLPGIPLAICAPHLHFTLLEATQKKVAFLDECIKRLELKNCVTLHARAEAAAHNIGTRADAKGITQRVGAQREQYDAVVARAVGAMPILAEITVPFAKPGGMIALIKGEKAPQEIEDAKQTLHEVKAVVDAVIPTPTGQIVVLSKRVTTPRLFPRPERVNNKKNKRAK